LLEQVGFQKVEIVGETGFNSTPKTKGVLIRAEKPAVSAKTVQSSIDALYSESKTPITGRRMPASIEAVLEEAFEIGCEEAKIIDTSTVIVERWVRWKCLYGCPFYNKDGFHPPFAPGVNETKEVLNEFSKAILLKGPTGKALTDIAVRLEGEAYKMGFYKAFALTALPSGAGGESSSGAT
jgi:hypothetical protein